MSQEQWNSVSQLGAVTEQVSHKFLFLGDTVQQAVIETASLRTTMGDNSQSTQCRWLPYLLSNNASMCTVVIQGAEEGCDIYFLYFYTNFSMVLIL